VSREALGHGHRADLGGDQSPTQIDRRPVQAADLTGSQLRQTGYNLDVV
jgi:hypothetical protein